jgi:hypothetical protein
MVDLERACHVSNAHSSSGTSTGTAIVEGQERTWRAQSPSSPHLHRISMAAGAGAGAGRIF